MRLLVPRPSWPTPSVSVTPPSTSRRPSPRLPSSPRSSWIACVTFSCNRNHSHLIGEGSLIVNNLTRWQRALEHNPADLSRNELWGVCVFVAMSFQARGKTYQEFSDWFEWSWACTE